MLDRVAGNKSLLGSLSLGLSLSLSLGLSLSLELELHHMLVLMSMCLGLGMSMRLCLCLSLCLCLCLCLGMRLRLSQESTGDRRTGLAVLIPGPAADHVPLERDGPVDVVQLVVQPTGIAQDVARVVLAPEWG